MQRRVSHAKQGSVILKNATTTVLTVFYNEYILCYIVTHIWKQRLNSKPGSAGSEFSVGDSNSFWCGLSAFSICRPFICTNMLHIHCKGKT